MVVKLLHEKGLKAEHAYTAAFASTGLSVVSWIGSLKGEPASTLLRIADTTAHVQQAAHPAPAPNPASVSSLEAADVRGGGFSRPDSSSCAWRTVVAGLCRVLKRVELMWAVCLRC
ncbi:hypothetical protein ACFC3O_29145 [Streptomyces sp. NPDC056007]|uniref:hypothetical protein n=1 Tax=Streptomyces sp. NPDC056007 TaxID=3345678 RepID=UPI00180C0E7E|nr:hypothetical protein [Streptomyces sp. SJ1-7]